MIWLSEARPTSTDYSFWPSQRRRVTGSRRVSARKRAVFWIFEINTQATRPKTKFSKTAKRLVDLAENIRTIRPLKLVAAHERNWAMPFKHRLLAGQVRLWSNARRQVRENRCLTWSTSWRERRWWITWEWPCVSDRFFPGEKPFYEIARIQPLKNCLCLSSAVFKGVEGGCTPSIVGDSRQDYLGKQWHKLHFWYV